MSRVSDGWRLAADIGGTFTDVVLVNARGDVQLIEKVLTTPRDPANGVMDGIRRVLRRAHASLNDVEYLLHGTTLITNALIERKGAQTALITTAGHEDALEIGRETRYDSYDLSLEKPVPLVPQPLRIGISARMLSDGSELRVFEEDEVVAAANYFISVGVEAVGVSLIHSYQNDAHEQAVEAVLARIAPSLRVSLSSVVVAEIREYERTSTTVANAYVLHLAEAYLRSLAGQLSEEGFVGQFLLTLSSGGTCTVQTACTVPIRLLESGPAGGVSAAAHYARASSTDHVLSFDMGGTTAKACFIDEGEPLITRDFEVARVWRFKRGSGFPIITPVIELIEIGAGGGSIAHVDRMGLPKVGPASAGAEPGPACYGRDGDFPTVTDANLILGYLDPKYFLGGRMTLDSEKAHRAVQRHVADQLSMSVEAAAWGIHSIVSENMANAIAVHAAERGKNIAAYILYAYGGAGPIHACTIAARLGLSTIVIPPGAGARSCFGFLASPLTFEVARSRPIRLGQSSWHDGEKILDALEEEASRPLLSGGIGREDITTRRWCEMRFAGQGYEIEVPLPASLTADRWKAVLQAGFVKAYESLYQHVPEGEIEIVTWRVRAQTQYPSLPAMRWHSDTRDPLKEHREVYVEAWDRFGSVPVYNRYALEPGTHLRGPVLIEEAEATTLVSPLFDVQVTPQLELVLRNRS